MSKGLTWSVQGWLLETPENKNAPQKKLTFAELSHAIMASVSEAGNVIEGIADATERNKIEEQRKILRSAAAQYINAGKRYDSEPTPANEQAMLDADKVMGHAHNQLNKMLEVHVKGSHSVNKGTLLKEQETAAKEVGAWRGQVELMQIDASSFEVAAKRLSRINNTIIQSLISDPTRKDLLSKQQRNWDLLAERWAALFTPPEDEKWMAANVFGEEDKLFNDFNELQKQIGQSV